MSSMILKVESCSVSILLNDISQSKIFSGYNYNHFFGRYNFVFDKVELESF
jgi:hypothetical protein